MEYNNRKKISKTRTNKQTGIYYIKTRGEKIFDIFNIVSMCILTCMFVIPFIYVLSNSLVSQNEHLVRGFVFLPHKIDFGAYIFLMKDQYRIIESFRDSVILTTVGTLMNMIFTIGMAYGLAKKKLLGRNLITGFIFFTMLFSGGMIPTYLVVKNLHLFNTYGALIMPGLISAWNLFILRNFFCAIPAELEESAFIDGANDIKVLTSIVLPLSIPAIITVGMFYAVVHWNSWFNVVLYIPKSNIVTLQYMLRTILANEVSAEFRVDIGERIPLNQLKMAAIIVSIIPIVIIFPNVQRFFVKGVMVGSVKG